MTQALIPEQQVLRAQTSVHAQAEICFHSPYIALLRYEARRERSIAYALYRQWKRNYESEAPHDETHHRAA